MKSIRAVILFSIVAGMVGTAWGQIAVTPQPDCLQNFSQVNVAGQTTNVQFDNRFPACDTWIIAYSSSGFATVTATWQSAPDVAGTPGVFGAFAGTILAGVNPLVATTQSRLVITGYNPWVRMNLVTTGANGTLNGTFYGFKTTPASAVAAVGCPNPCPVVGGAAAGSPPSGNPVVAAGSDGTNVRILRTDPTGRQLSETAPDNNLCTGLRDSVALMAVPTASTLVPFASTGVTHCVAFFEVSNTTAGSLTITVTDNQGSPVTFLNAFSIPANSQLLQPLYGMAFTTGIKWIASGAGMTGGWVATQ